MSLSQKIRRDLLRIFIIQTNFLDRIKRLISEFNILSNSKYTDVLDVINHKYLNEFDKFLIRPKVSSITENKGTKVGINIIQFFNNLNNENLELYLHGSHADETVTNYSDIDVSIFIKNISADNLLKIRADIIATNNFIKKLDLDSHHSIFLNLADDKNYYPESFMPISVLNKSIFNPAYQLNISKTRFCYDITLDNFYNISNNTLKLINDLNDFNSKNLKLIISQYFMVIILYEQICNDNFDDKRSIFLKIQENEKLLNKYKAFLLCSKIRESWPKQENYNTFGISKIFLSNIKNDVLYFQKEIEKSINFKKVLDLIC